MSDINPPDTSQPVQQSPQPTWPHKVQAVSVAVIALCVLIITVALAYGAYEVHQTLAQLASELQKFGNQFGAGATDPGASCDPSTMPDGQC